MSATAPDTRPRTKKKSRRRAGQPTQDEVLARYRRLTRAQRRRISRAADKKMRAVLAHIEREIALERSPGSMAAILTDGREMQAPHLALIDKVFRDIAAGHSRKVLITMPPRHGKALALDTPVATPSGWTTMGDLNVGDQVFDETGKPCTVTWTSPTWYDRPCYDVVTDSGEHIVADQAHEWKASLDRRRNDHLYTTEDLARPRGKQAMIWAAGPLDLPDADLPIHPYVLGVWLGDGLSKDSAVVAVGDDGKYIRAEVEACGYVTANRKNQKVFSVVGLSPLLRANGLFGNKHVPAAYLRASRTQRQALLQGLIDTDGHVAPDGQVEFCSIKLGLAEAVRELVCSLGGKASLITGDATLNGRFISKKYRVMFYMDGAARLPRKAVLCRSGIRANRHYVVAMRRSATATRCIEVDSPSHTFLAGKSLLPTHNSRRAARWAPLWFLSRHPNKRIMIASYGADLADEHGRWIRDAITAWGDQIGLYLHSGSKAANRFDLADKHGNRLDGGLVTAGVGGGLTGKGADVAIVDDPIKDAADAQSPTKRNRLWEWWTAVLNTRIEPGGSIVVIQTRWDEADLAGKILAGETASDWTVIDLPAYADSEDDPLGRPLGAPLWPKRYGRKALAKIRRAVGERVWWSLFMQKPRPMEGGVWKWSWITDHRRTLEQFAGIDLTRIVVAVDHAGGDGLSNDEVGLCAAGKDADDHLYLLADRSGRMGADTWGLAACRLAISCQADAIVVEDNFGGDMAEQIIAQSWRDLAEKGETNGMLRPAILPVHAKVGKRLRAEPIAQLYEQGRCHHVGDEEQFERVETQMVTWIPGMDSPDRMDAVVHALTELADPQAATTKRTGPYKDNRLRGRR
jgi:hypothetical protein